MAHRATYATVLGVQALLAVCAPTLARERPPSADPSGVTRRLPLECTVDDKGFSKLCSFYIPIDDEKARRLAGTELAWLDAHPFAISGAPPGTEVKVLVRLTVAPIKGTPDFRITAPAGEFPLAAGPEVTSPLWEMSPYAPWADPYIPERLARLNQKGEATVRCVVTEAGTLTNCWVVSETPPDGGLGEAVPLLLQRARMKTVDAAGEPVAGRPVVVTMKFPGFSHWPPTDPLHPHWAR